jgi:membrane protein YqaA with SNARE-associated domain
MVIGYKYFTVNAKWLKKGAIWGLLVGGMTFVAGHLIVAGWATIPPKPMLISGILDTMATVATGIVIAYFYRNK